MTTKIKALYEDPKSKGFVNHLIHAYMPVNKVEKIWNWKKGQKHVCNICGQKLVSISEIFAATQKPEFMEDFMANIKKDINGEKRTRDDNPYVKAIGKDKLQGYTGQKTDTCMCHQCAEDLLNMVSTGLLMDDKNIVYQVNQMQRNQVFDQFRKSPALNKEDKKVVKDIKKLVDKDRVVSTFGDLQALKDLKEKMESN